MLELFSSLLVQTASVDNKVILEKTDVGNHAVFFSDLGYSIYTVIKN